MDDTEFGALLTSLQALQEVGRTISADTREKLTRVRTALQAHDYHPKLNDAIAILDQLLAEPDELQERDFSADQRAEYAKSGIAMPDGSYPIPDKDALRRAIASWGRGGASPAVKAHIIKRAKALGATDMLPADWSGSTKPQESIQDSEFEESIETHLVEGAGDKSGRLWDVILIQSGMSKNRRYYPPDVLKEAVPLFNGRPCFADHATSADLATRPERSIRDKVGQWSGARYGSFGQHEGVRARLTVVAPWFRQQLMEAVEAGVPDFIGFSIDARGTTERRAVDGQQANYVKKIDEIRSADAVTDAAAGGRLERLVASNTGVDNMEKEELEKLIADRVSAAVATALAEKPKDDTAVLDEIKKLQEATRKADGKARLTEALAGCGLSDISKGQIRKRFAEVLESKDFSDEELAAEIKESGEYEAALAQQFLKGTSFGGGRMQARDDGRETLVSALINGAFGMNPDLEKSKGIVLEKDADGHVVPGIATFREAYCRWTGTSFADYNPLAMFRELQGGTYFSGSDHSRITESLTTSSWSSVFADVAYLMLMKVYSSLDYATWWRQFVSNIENVPDFQTRHWDRVGGYANLSTVSQQATYPTLTSPTNEEVTYLVQKRGGLDDLTLETIVNDRVGAIRRIPIALARAAARSLYVFVMNLMTTDNPTMDYDSVALYAAGHSNTATNALALSAVNTGIQSMRAQTAYNEASEVLGARNLPKFIIVNNTLWQRAERIFNPSLQYIIAPTVDTDTSIDPTAFKGMGITVFAYDTLTGTTNWYMVASPAEVETAVVGFLNGQDTPELFVQDQPNVGATFTADKITYKIRFIYGGDILEHRSFYRGNT